MNHLKIIFTSSCLLMTGYTQSQDLFLFSSGGSVAASGNLYLSYSFGEPCIEPTLNGNTWVTEGFQQPDPIDLMTSVPSERVKYSISIFPNPVKSELMLSGHGLLSGTYEIMNIMGQVIRSGKIIPNETHTIPAIDLEPGMYFLSLSSQSSHYLTQPFIKL